MASLLWLCDLGFGSYGIRAPIDLGQTDKQIEQDQDIFSIEKSEKGEYLLKAYAEDAWANQYAFDLHPWEWIDFAPANYMNSTHPDAIFVQKRLLIIQHQSGRSILLGNQLKDIQSGIVNKSDIEDDLIEKVLSTHFGLSK